MTHNEILLMAMDAGFQHSDAVGKSEEFAFFDMYKFADMVAAYEREQCAKVCDDWRPRCAEAIRARK